MPENTITKYHQYQPAWNGHRESKLYNTGLAFFSGKYTHGVDKYKHWAYNSDDIQKYWACIVDDHCKWQHNITFEDIPPLEKTLTRHSRA